MNPPRTNPMPKALRLAMLAGVLLTIAAFVLLIVDLNVQKSTVYPENGQVTDVKSGDVAYVDKLYVVGCYNTELNGFTRKARREYFVAYYVNASGVTVVCSLETAPGDPLYDDLLAYRDDPYSSIHDAYSVSGCFAVSKVSALRGSKEQYYNESLTELSAYNEAFYDSHLHLKYCAATPNDDANQRARTFLVLLIVSVALFVAGVALTTTMLIRGARYSKRKPTQSKLPNEAFHFRKKSDK